MGSELSFKQKIRTVAGFVCRLFTLPLNCVWFYLFHRKFIGVSEQRALWEGRLEDDYRQLLEVGKDEYYQTLDLKLFEKLELSGAKNFLEVGCFLGHRLNGFAGRIKNSRFVGLDFGLKNLGFAKERVIKNRNIDLINADACMLPFKDSSIEVVYTAVCLTHIPFSRIKSAVDEITRVCSKGLILVEVDHRPMGLMKKAVCLNWKYGYMHPYEKFVGDKMKLTAITPLRDSDNNPRYTFFQFSKTIPSPLGGEG